MSSVAVIAHTGKTLDGGLPQLKRALEAYGVTGARWYGVPKSRLAPGKLARALEEGAELIYVWGGDGMVQRCMDVAAGSHARIAIVPAGTANLFASNLGIPKSIDGAVEVGLQGSTRKIDVGRMNGEKFAVMAGVGFDAFVIRDAGRELKRKLGRTAYVWAAAKNLRVKPFEARIDVDGERWFRGRASLVLFGNVGEAFAGIKAFDDARPDDGLLEIGVGSADGIVEWSRTLMHSAVGNVSDSPFVTVTKGRSVQVRLDRKVLYELDGGVRKKTRKFCVDVVPSAVTVCVPGGERPARSRSLETRSQ